jgi:predicted Rossmann-fold nucleotide-binding protein
MGRTLAERGLRLVYGGGQVGLMGVVADACIDAGGEVTGVIPDFLHHKEIAHPRVQDMHIV